MFSVDGGITGSCEKSRDTRATASTVVPITGRFVEETENSGAQRAFHVWWTVVPKAAFDFAFLGFLVLIYRRAFEHSCSVQISFTDRKKTSNADNLTLTLLN